MFRTKQDVDKHSQEIFKIIKAEKERNLLCLGIAQQYYYVRDYESAERYVTLYLSVKDDSSVGHKLLALCYEYFGENDRALTEYKYSLELDSKQPELILKVCGLLADSIAVDENQAKYWLGKGESQFPYHPIVFKLKQKVSSLGDDKNSEAVEPVIIDKVPSFDPTLDTEQLIRLYIENNRIKDAYDVAVFGETQAFLPSLQWYQSRVRICELFKTNFPNAVNEDFYAIYLLALERVVALSVQDVKIECISSLARFDEMLSIAAECMNKSEGFRTIISHMSGQLCYHTAIVLYREIKVVYRSNSCLNVTRLIAPLLLLSIDKGFAVPDVEKQNNTLSRVLGQCAFHSSYRITQAGLVLKSLAKKYENYFIKRVLNFCVANWRQRIAERVYRKSDFKKFSEKSFFIDCTAFSKVPSELPTNLLDNIEGQVAVVEVTQPSSLHHLVWLGVQFLSLSGKTSICEVLLPVNFCVTSFTNLQFVHDGSTSSDNAESLDRIDVDAFLFACVYCAKSLQLQQMNTENPLFSQVFPADVSSWSFCSPAHEYWWESAVKMSQQMVQEEAFSHLWLDLRRGLEAVRLIGSASLPLPLLVLLGRTFANKATIESNSEHASALKARASLYWEAALPLLNKIVLNESYPDPSTSMFEYFGNIRNVISPGDAKKLIVEGKRFLGMKRKDYSDTLLAHFIEENAATCQPHNLSSSFVNQKILEMLTDQNRMIVDQNRMIVDRLETLFQKQELLLSSNQLRLVEMISQLKKKMDDFCLSEEYCQNRLSQSVQPLSPHHRGSGLYNENGEAAKSSSISAGMFPATNNIQPQFPTQNIQTHFPWFQRGTTVSSYLPPPMQYHFSNASVPNITHRAPLPFASVPSFQPVAPQQFSYEYTSSWNKSAVVDSNNATVTSVMNQYPSTVSSVRTNVSSATSQTSSVFSGFHPRFREAPPPDPAKLTTTVPRVSHVPWMSPQPALVHVPTSIITPETRPPFAFQNTTPTSGSTGAANSFQVSVPTSDTVVQSPSVQVPEQEEESVDDTAYEEHDSILDSKLIIPLPDEENEEVVFESHAKLFRFVDTVWKEGGIGLYKILKNRETGRVRVLMRRQAVHTICANHLLSDNLTLTKLPGNGGLAWVYCTLDLVEEKMVIETLCVKFLTPQIAAQFRQIFDKCKLLNAASTLVKSKTASLATLLTSNSSTPITTTPARSTDNPAKPIVIVSPKTPDMTATAEASETQFGGSEPSAVTAAADSAKTQVVDCSPFSGFLDFSSLSQKSGTSSAFVESKDFQGFAGAGSPVFGSGSNQPAEAPAAVTSPAPSKTVEVGAASTNNESTADDSQNGNADDEFVPAAEFAPMVPLPELVEVTTGEEGLEVLYGGHCSLFRFVNTYRYWEKRGVGMMKILRDPKDGSVRMLMRKRQEHKVCCSQRLSADVELEPSKTKMNAWMWSAEDFSEGRLTTEVFCARFKTVEQANKFKRAFEDAQESLWNWPSTAAAAGEQDYYVDEQGIEDAMEDLDYLENESETVFRNSAMLQVIEEGIAVDYPGVVKVVKNYDPETDTATAFVEFSTPGIPSLYRAEIVRDSVAIKKILGCIIFPTNNKCLSEDEIVLRFTNEQLAFNFLDVFNIMKQMGP